MLLPLIWCIYGGETWKLSNESVRKLASWKDSSQGSTALLIEGARRVGKSTIAEEFGRRNYASYMLVDFSKAPDDVLGYFVDLRNDLDAFFMYLSSFYGVELHRRDSLIIFDEVQLYPKAREAIKQLVADGRYDYIETGSLVSIRENVKDILIPSEEESIRLNPMDFDEFLWALGEKPLSTLIADSFKKRRPLPDSLHRKAMRLFREYMLVGGMPQAVSKYVETHDSAKSTTSNGTSSDCTAGHLQAWRQRPDTHHAHLRQPGGSAFQEGEEVQHHIAGRESENPRLRGRLLLAFRCVHYQRLFQFHRSERGLEH